MSDLNIQEEIVDFPTKLIRRCDQHIQALQEIKRKVEQGKGKVNSDMLDFALDVNQTLIMVH